jgi:hypothetical protein
MHTLEGFALDDERGFFGCDEALLDGIMHLGNQRRVLMTATGRVTTKGVFCGMDDGVFHQDEKGWLLLAVCHRSDGPFCVTRTHVWIDRRFHGAYTMR